MRAAGRGGGWRIRLRLALLGAVALFHVGSVLLGSEPGALSVDERTYWWMTRSLVKGHGLGIENGFEERPSPELLAAAVVERDGRLVASPPYLFPVLAAPFYRGLGFRGLFVLNGLAFAATLALTAALAREIGFERDAALDAALILAFATYLGDYAQGAWPHGLATLFAVAAALAALRGLRTDRVGRVWSFVAGAVAGVAVGVRLDLLALVPVVVAAPLGARPADWRPSALAAAGCAPGLAVLAWTNRLKFGSWSLLSYGREGATLVGGIGEYLPAAALGVAVLTVGGVVFSGGRVPRALRIGLPVVAGLALASWPASRGLLAGWASGLWQLVVDLRAREPSLVEPVLERGPGGSLAYLGAVKKALLQSCPYLAVLPLGTPPRTRPHRIVLLGIPLLYVMLYAAFAWHGGLALNLRYWTPVLPFAALGVAAAFARLPRAGRGLAIAVAAAAALAVAVAARARPAVELQEPIFLTAPLVLAGLLGGCALAARLAPRVPLAGRLTRGLAAAGLGWAGAVLYTWDLPHAMGWRRANAAVTRRAAAVVPEGALLFTPYLEPFFGLIESDVILADPTRDAYADLAALASFHLRGGRPVFAALRPEVWGELERGGSLAGLRVKPLWEGGAVRLARLEPDAAAAMVGSPGSSPP